uniref:RRM domain-containing protein n=1 Tax=Entomoneis paludosa TaxID=265537 RepID=A0A7S2VD87_9STRA|mmetsp:Transcript_17526/g.36298  ORF Transcript_17526/g.36298 Transcript_17526/m.36298 type:complete len:252 (+) Transcript_17526:450-1205(+)
MRSDKLSQKKQKAAKVEELKRQGKEMRENYADRQSQQPTKPIFRAPAPSKPENMEDRQVRLKWSRKKMKISPSEHSLAQLMQAFGKVEEVEMLGKKGNAALVTFISGKSCAPCVEAYLESNEMRASYVGGRKETEERKKKHEEEESNNISSTTSQKDDSMGQESVKDYQLRRAAEREHLLRQMEQDEDDAKQSISEVGKESKQPAKTANQRQPPSSFPPDFPSTDEFKACKTPFEKLNLAESQILKPLLSG